MKRRHPTSRRLQAWLETGEPVRVGRHVSECDHCLTSLDDLTDLDDALVADIAEAYAPPSGIEDRTSAQLERRLRDEDAFVTFLDLFATAWDVARTVFDSDETEEGADG